MTRRTWSELEKPVDLAREEMELDRIVHAALQTKEGAALLSVMHRLTTEKRNRREDSDGALRWDEAQRNFVAILEARAARHQQRIAQPPKTETDGGRSEPQSRQRRRRRGDTP